MVYVVTLELCLLQPAVFTLSVPLWGSRFIVKGSPSGHRTEAHAGSPPHSSASHITMSELLTVISTCIILAGSESAGLDSVFWPYNPSERRSSRRQVQAAPRRDVPLIDSSGRGEEGDSGGGGRSSCCVHVLHPHQGRGEVGGVGVIQTFGNCFQGENPWTQAPRGHCKVHNPLTGHCFLVR